MNSDWLERDFYKLLGVGEEAGAEEIKKAYRKLAQKLHPDANPDDPVAAERFKEVSEAYAVLSDEEKRREYDQVRAMGSGAFGGFGGGGGFGGRQRARVEDLFGDGGADLGGIFGGFGRRRNRPRSGEDQTARLRLSFEEAVRGAAAVVETDGEAACSRCRGRGAEPGTGVEACGRCGGEGTIASNQGVFSFANPCPECRGSGRIISSPCSTCRGSGRERRTRRIKVKVPAGVSDGGTIRLPGKGGPGAGGGPPGDLLVKVRVDDHPVFTRRGKNLHLKLPVSFTDAALGAKVQIPTLNGWVTLRIPPGTPSGRIFAVRKQGAPGRRGQPGDLLVETSVTVPDKLPRAARKMLEEFRERFEAGSPESEPGPSEPERDEGGARRDDPERDRALINYLARAFREEHGVDLLAEPESSGARQIMQRLKDAAAAARMELEEAPETEVNLPFITSTAGGPLHLRLKITRDEMRKLTEGEGR